MKGMLFSQMEPSPALEPEFNEWYETEHIPARLALPGFAAAVRYVEVGGARKYLAIYEISDMKVLDTPVYQRLKTDPSARTARMLRSVAGFTRFTCNQTYGNDGKSEGDFLSAVAFDVPQADRPAFDDWYAAEHIPLLMQAAGWLRVRRYSVLSSDGGPWTHFALHELESPDVMNSPELKAAQEGPKREQFAGKPWFENSARWLYKVISRHRRTGSN
jgi:hypothetical protein